MPGLQVQPNVKSRQCHNLGLIQTQRTNAHMILGWTQIRKLFTHFLQIHFLATSSFEPYCPNMAIQNPVLWTVGVLDKSDLCRRFADGFDVHKGRLFDSKLYFTVVLIAKFLKQLPHPRQRHFRWSGFVGHVSWLDHDLHQQLLISAQLQYYCRFTSQQACYNAISLNNLQTLYISVCNDQWSAQLTEKLP